jgi:hypothetical protein
MTCNFQGTSAFLFSLLAAFLGLVSFSLLEYNLIKATQKYLTIHRQINEMQLFDIQGFSNSEIRCSTILESKLALWLVLNVKAR